MLTGAVILQMHLDGDKFLARFITYFDGEKDPRNLMVVFSVLRVVMTEWDISSCIQVSDSQSRPLADFIGCLRRCIQLLSDHISPTAGRRVQSHVPRSKGQAEDVSGFNPGVCAVCPPGPLRQARLDIHEHEGIMHYIQRDH